MNKKYILSVTVMAVVIPLGGFLIECLRTVAKPDFALFAKWFVFSAAGLRLFVAGLQQTLKPAFTANEIFHIQNPDCHPIVRELGFANICFGLMGIMSMFKPSWRPVAAFACGIYYCLAALLHIIKKPAGANERFALVSGVYIFVLLTACFLTDVSEFS